MSPFPFSDHHGLRGCPPRLIVRSKVWFEVEGRRVFSVGRMQLLEAIDAEGSIQKAAKRLRMSYRAAWGKLKATEETLGVVLLDRSIGGPRGGGAQLTEAARDLMASYRLCCEAASTAADKSFDKAFGQGIASAPRRRRLPASKPTP